MNGKQDPAVLPLSIDFIVEEMTSPSVNISSNAGYNAEWTIAKIPGYRLFAIGGFESVVMSRFYRLDFEIGDDDEDTLLIGIKNTSPSSATTVQVTFQLVYIKE